MWRTQVHLELEEQHNVEKEVEEEEFAHVSGPPHGRSRIEIVLPSRNVSHMEDIRGAGNSFSETETESEEEVMVSTRVKVTQRRIDFQEFYHHPQSPSQQRRQRTYGNMLDDDEYEPPSRSRSRRREYDMATPTKKVVTRNGLATPPSAEFSQDALQFVRNINKKRKPPMDTSHGMLLSKKSKLSKN